MLKLNKISEKQYTFLKNNGYEDDVSVHYENGTIVDYKTVSSKPNEQEIPFNYKMQTLAYAYIFRQLGYPIERIRIVYGVKPLKTTGARCFVVTENITFPDEQMINKIIKLMCETIQLSVEHPEYNHIIYKDYALKEK